MRCNNSHNLFVVKQECRRIVLALVFTVTHIVQSMRIIFLLFYILITVRSCYRYVAPLSANTEQSLMA